jgi:hypothetical protein
MRALHTNRPFGAQWSRVFGARLSENSFDEIDKGVRSRLQNCLDNLPPSKHGGRISASGNGYS